jgi:hypothetical protein
VNNPDQATPSWLELESMRSMAEAARLTNLSADTLKRRYPHWVTQVSPRRNAMKLRHILAITNSGIAAEQPPSHRRTRRRA